MNLAELHLLRPAWLAALLILVPMAWVLLRQRRAAGPWERLCDAHLLRHLLEPASARGSRWPLVLLALGWTAACVAMAGPTWERLAETAFREPSRTVFVLGLSPSMTNDDVRPSRLARARFKLLDALDRLAGGSVALVVYREEAFAVTPLTDDANVLREQVRLLRTSLAPGRKVLPARGIEVAQHLLERVGVAGSRIVLVSDGGDDDPSASADAVRAAAAGGVRVSVLSLVGDSGPLEALARAGGGDFAALAVDDADLDRVLAAPDPLHQGALVKSDVQADRWTDAGAWLVWLPLLLAPFAFRKGWAAAALVALWVGFAPAPARADLLDWFERPDQRAAQAFDAGRYADAAREFRDPAWQSAARYRAGDFAGAAAALAERSDPASQYNRGNALARGGRLEEALGAYDQSLAANPRDADARFNRDLVKRLLDEQAQRSSPPPDASKGSGAEDAQPEPGSDGAAKDASPGDAGSDAEAQESSPGGADSDAQAKDGSPGGADADAQAKGASPGAQGEDPAAGSGSSAAESEPERGDPARDAEVASGEPRDGALPQAPGSARAPAPSAKDQEMAQWMARLPDDPGGLLRERIRRDYLRKQGARLRGENP